MEHSIGPVSLSIPPADAWAFYLYVVVFTFLIRYILVMRPTITLVRKYNPEIKNILRSLISIKNVFGIKGIESYLVRELVTLVLPAFSALLIRIILGNPEDVGWSDERLILMISFAFLLSLAEIRRSMVTRKKIIAIIDMNLSPFVVKSGLGALRWTRSALDSVSSMKLVEEESPQEVLKGHLSSIISNPFKMNTFDNAKAAVKTLGAAARDIAGTAAEKIDNQVQNVVDKQIKFDKGSFLVDMTMSLFPLIVIYGLLPMLS